MSPTYTTKLDLRGLEPPEPMARILEALGTTPGGVTIEAHLERRPMFLIEELKRRAQPHSCTQLADGSWTMQLPVAGESAASTPTA